MHALAMAVRLRVPTDDEGWIDKLKKAWPYRSGKKEDEDRIIQLLKEGKPLHENREAHAKHMAIVRDITLSDGWRKRLAEAY